MPTPRAFAPDENNLAVKPWDTAPFFGPVEVTELGEVIPPAGMRVAPCLRNDVGPAFVPERPELWERTWSAAEGWGWAPAPAATS